MLGDIRDLLDRYGDTDTPPVDATDDQNLCLRAEDGPQDMNSPSIILGVEQMALVQV